MSDNKPAVSPKNIDGIVRLPTLFPFEFMCGVRQIPPQSPRFTVYKSPIREGLLGGGLPCPEKEPAAARRPWNREVDLWSGRKRVGSIMGADFRKR